MEGAPGKGRSRTRGPEMNPVQEEKKTVRNRLRAKLKLISVEHREQASQRAGALLKDQIIWHKAGSVLFYAALNDEIDLGALLREAMREGKTVALPRFISEKNSYAPCRLGDADELCSGKFGVIEPHPDSPVHPLNQLDLVLVPGVGFDVSGRRLGRGRGFYDRLLANIRGLKIGVGFDEQIESAIPSEPHDVRLDFLLTPTRWIRAAQPEK
jgi:5-formyltetrahydrofolate cyclo-ligase